MVARQMVTLALTGQRRICQIAPPTPAAGPRQASGWPSTRGLLASSPELLPLPPCNTVGDGSTGRPPLQAGARAAHTLFVGWAACTPPWDVCGVFGACICWFCRIWLLLLHGFCSCANLHIARPSSRHVVQHSHSIKKARLPSFIGALFDSSPAVPQVDIGPRRQRERRPVQI